MSSTLQQGAAFLAVALSAAIASAVVARRFIEIRPARPKARRRHDVPPEGPSKRNPMDPSARTE